MSGESTSGPGQPDYIRPMVDVAGAAMFLRAALTEGPVSLTYEQRAVAVQVASDRLQEALNGA